MLPLYLTEKSEENHDKL